MIELKRVIDKSTIIVIDRSSRQKINKDRVDGNGTINQLDLFDIYWILHPQTAEYTFYSSSHGGFTKTDHILDHDIHLNKLKRVVIIQSQFSDHSRIKLGINN